MNEAETIQLKKIADKLCSDYSYTLEIDGYMWTFYTEQKTKSAYFNVGGYNFLYNLLRVIEAFNKELR